MTSAERQQIMDIAELQVNRYFDHYLTTVFPEQIDRLFNGHNVDIEAHPVQFKMLDGVEQKVNRAAWMIVGMSALISFAGAMGALAYYWYNARPMH
jgi:hypothetical protein